MNGAVSAINQQPFISVTDVRIGRKFNDEGCFMYPGPDCFPSPGWPDEDSIKTTKLFDDGTNGDLVAGDNIWSKDIHFPRGYEAKIEYMYSANWGLPTNNGGNNNESILRKHRIHFPINISSATVVDTFGNVGEHPLTNVVIVDIEAETPNVVSSYSLEQNYPNPFNPSTTIRYSIPEAGLVNLSVYNMLGEKIAILVNEFKNSGSYEMKFSNQYLTAGVYFYSISVNDFTKTKKMVLTK